MPSSTKNAAMGVITVEKCSYTCSVVVTDLTKNPCEVSVCLYLFHRLYRADSDVDGRASLIRFEPMETVKVDGNLTEIIG